MKEVRKIIIQKQNVQMMIFLFFGKNRSLIFSPFPTWNRDYVDRLKIIRPNLDPIFSMRYEGEASLKEKKRKEKKSREVWSIHRNIFNRKNDQNHFVIDQNSLTDHIKASQRTASLGKGAKCEMKKCNEAK